MMLAVVLVTAAVVLAVSGGFRTTVGGFRVSVRSPLATSIAALVAGAWWWYLARRARSVAADLEHAWQWTERHSSRSIGAVALAAAFIAATFATRSAAGADASGYLSEAEFLSKGAAFHYVHMFPYSEHTWLTTPLGWIPRSSDVQTPSYPPGLPLLMAIPHKLAGINGATAVVIASAAIAVWASGMIAGGAAGLIAALLLALSPVFLYQSIQPMSDVPVTAAWMVCFLMLTRSPSPFAAGVACAVAVLIRPNLAPLALVPLYMANRKLVFAAPVALAGAFLAFTQWLWYGSPLQSGYGSAGDLFSFSNIGPNAVRYFSWLIATAPVLLLAPFGFARLKADARSRALAAFAALVIAAYLAYGVFDHWSYLRFLLPAMAVFALFAAVGLDAWIRRSPMSWRAPMLVALALAVTAHGLFVARSRETFKLADQLRRVEQVADFVRENVPEGAVILSGEQSGSMRYYTGRAILRWEAATPETLSWAIATLEDGGRPVYIVLDAWENEPFRQKLGTLPDVALDWPAVLEAGTSHRTRLWRVGDRARFLNGEHLSTIRLP